MADTRVGVVMTVAAVAAEEAMVEEEGMSSSRFCPCVPNDGDASLTFFANSRQKPVPLVRDKTCTCCRGNFPM